jgi:predicted glycoside hydrolase/deacetylase ChbG (UPF0249 family)
MAVGAHVVLVGEDRPVLTAREVPTLVDRSGRFPLTWTHVVRRSVAGRIDPDDLCAEIDAQLARLRAMGIAVTHIDTHQHLHLWPAIREPVLDAAARHSIRAVRVPSSGRRGPMGTGIRRLAARLRCAARDRDLRTAERSAGLDGAGSLTAPTLVTTIDRLSATGASSCELWAHPGVDADPDRSRYDWNYRWSEELEALCSTQVRRAVERGGFRLGTYAHLP